MKWRFYAHRRVVKHGRVHEKTVKTSLKCKVNNIQQPKWYKFYNHLCLSYLHTKFHWANCYGTLDMAKNPFFLPRWGLQTEKWVALFSVATYFTFFCIFMLFGHISTKYVCPTEIGNHDLFFGPFRGPLVLHFHIMGTQMTHLNKGHTG